MKFICNKKDLLTAVVSLRNAVADKSVNPSLEGLLLKTNNNKLEVYGYDLELGIKTSIDIDLIEEGSIILSAKIFGEIIKNMPSPDVEIEVNDEFMTFIRGGLSSFSIKGIDPQEYPSLPSIDESESFSVPQKILKSMIKQTIFAVSVSDTKPIYTGAMFEIKDKKFKIIAIDGCRMAIREEDVIFSDDKEKNFVVPKKTLNELLHLSEDNDDEVKISVDRKYVTFEMGKYYIISRLLEGEFMNYENAIPKEYETKVTVSVNKFNESIKRVSLLISDKYKYPIRCIFADQSIKISCLTSMGKANDELDAVIDGASIEMGFNEKFITEALENSEMDEVYLEMKNPYSPLKVIPKEGNSFLFLVLPVRLRS